MPDRIAPASTITFPNTTRSPGTDETASALRSEGALPPAFGPPSVVGEVGTLGPYRIVKELGKGGMGAVYLAVDTRLDRKVAFKVMLPEYAANPSARERFLREARAAAQIAHDHVVTVFEADERDEVPYIAMQFLLGSPLDKYLQRKGPPPLLHVVRIAREAALGLAAAHRLGLVHRDIKPANLWLEAPNGRVKVLDFGLAKPIGSDAELTRSGAVMGTPAYMSPEQGRGQKIDHRTDLFSLGAVMYRLCTGRNPFEGEHVMAVLAALIADEPTPIRELNPQVPEPLAQLVHQLLAKKPELRPQTATEVASRLRTALDQFLGPNTVTPRGSAPATDCADESSSFPVVVNPVPAQPPLADPIHVTGTPVSAFADLNRADAEGPTTIEPISRIPAPDRQMKGKKVGFVAGIAVLLAGIAGGVVAVSTSNRGAGTTASLPVSVTAGAEPNGKIVAPTPPTPSVPQQPVAAANPDRTAAEWVLSIGGTVHVYDWEPRVISAGTALPKHSFTVIVVHLPGIRHVSDAGLANLKGCSGLKMLRLTQTAITDAGLAHLQGCTSLEALAVSYTAVTDVGLSYLKDCKLTELDLSQCAGVTDAGIAHFKDCPLERLHLNGTRATDAGATAFTNTTKLKALSLNKTVTDAGLAHFRDCDLTELKLADSQTTDAGVSQFRNVKRLKSLNLGNTRVTDTGLAHFKDCRELETLDVHDLPITDAGLSHFKESVHLTTINLGGCAKVTDVGLSYFQKCRQLTKLWVKKTKVSPAMIAEFSQALPACWILHNDGEINPKK